MIRSEFQPGTYLKNAKEKRWPRFFLFVFSAAFLSASPLLADTKFFRGNNGSSWSDPNNWDPFGVPQSDDSAYFDWVSPDCTVDTNISILELNTQGYNGQLDFPGWALVTLDSIYVG